VKNKVAPPFRVCEFDIMYGEGISKTGEILDIGTNAGIIDKSGSWFSYGDTKLGQGRDSVKNLLKDNPELCEELEKKISDSLPYYQALELHIIIVYQTCILSKHDQLNNLL